MIPEENLFGLYRHLLAGEGLFDGIELVGVNRIGALLSPREIAAEAAP